MLGGCSGTGSLTSAGDGMAVSSGGASGAGGDSTRSSPLAAALREQGHTVTALGEAVSDLGGTVAGVVKPLVGDASAQGVNGLVGHTGGVVSAVGSAVANGVGQLGKVDNPLGITAAGAGGAVVQAGQGVSRVGQGVETSLSAGSVEQVGRGLNTAIVPITDGVTQVAARVNDATPVGNLLVTTGGAVQQLGVGVQGNGSQPVVNSLGEVVNQTGGLVANLGGAVGGTTGGGGAGVLAPVVNTVGTLTGGITTSAGGGQGGGGITTPLTTTLTNTLGGLTGSLTGALNR